MKRVECCITHVTGRPWEGRLRRGWGWEGGMHNWFSRPWRFAYEGRGAGWRYGLRRDGACWRYGLKKGGAGQRDVQNCAYLIVA